MILNSNVYEGKSVEEANACNGACREGGQASFSKNFLEESQIFSEKKNIGDVNLSEFFAISDPAVVGGMQKFSLEEADLPEVLPPENFEESSYEIYEMCEMSHHESKKEENSFESPTRKNLENLNLDLDFVESSQNFHGNYHNYVTRVLRSIVPLRCINYSNILEENKIILPECEIKKKTLILDLDETLIHADFDNNFADYDHLVSFHYEGQEVTVPIILRPGLFEFLQNASEIFEIFIFTASKKEYADAVLNYLDPENKIFKRRFYRDNCINIKNRIFLKDLRLFVNRKPENIIIVDNSLYSFSNQLSNGILINSFYNDREDRELFNLFNYLLEYIKNAPDSRTINEKVFNFNMIFEEYSDLHYFNEHDIRF